VREGIPHGCANTEQRRTGLLVETEAKVPIISTPQGFNEEELYVDLEPTFGHSVFLKCEGFNFAGSIKLKAAIEMVEAAERDGVLRRGSVLV
jgi:N-(2-amino-2-carboxyethyl)-L-glutamate synthase